MKRILSDSAFYGGSLIGQNIYYARKKSTSKKQDKHQSNSSSHSNSEKLYIPTSEEMNLLVDSKKCKDQRNKCCTLAYRIFQLTPNLLYTKKQIREQHRKLGLDNHFDKTGDDAKMIVINSARNILLEVCHP